MSKGDADTAARELLEVWCIDGGQGYPALASLIAAALRTRDERLTALEAELVSARETLRQWQTEKGRANYEARIRGDDPALADAVRGLVQATVYAEGGKLCCWECCRGIDDPGLDECETHKALAAPALAPFRGRGETNG